MKLVTFGTPGLQDAGDLVPLAPKNLAVLVFLAVDEPGGVRRRDKLLPVFWPDLDQGHARNALSQVVYQLRRTVGDEAVVSHGKEGLRVDPDVLPCDAVRFLQRFDEQDWQGALEQYGGEFLDGFHLSGVPEFERWLDVERQHLHRRAVEAALEAAEEAEAAGELDAAVGLLRRGREIAPTHEQVTRRLVALLDRAGERAGAVRTYEMFAARLEAEMGLEPSPETRELIEAVRERRYVRTDSDGRTAGGVDVSAPSDPIGRPTEETEESREDPSPSERPAPGPESGVPGVPESDDRAAASPVELKSSALRRTGTIAAAVLVLIAAAFGLRKLVSPGSGGTAAEGPSVAVLPFEAIGTENPGPIAQGLHDDLVTRLANVSGIEVISASSVERFRDAGLPLPAIADSLRVEWVLEGEVQQAGDVIRVNAQLIDPSTNTHAWADSYRRNLTAENLFDVMGEISGRVTEVLATRIGSAELGRLRRRSTGSLDAYRFYVRGRSLLEQRSPPDMLRSLDYFDQALMEDSTYALAWAGRADALAILARFPGFSSDTLLPQASEAADRALALAPDLAEAHLARGRLFMYRRDAADALREFERAVELRPSYAAAHAWLAKLQLSIGRPTDALEDAKRAVGLDPLSPETLATLIIARHVDGDIHRVLELARRIEQLTGEPVGHELVALAHLSRLEELRTEFRDRGLSIAENPLLALYITEAGGSAPVEEALATAEEHDDSRTAALLHAVGGHAERALDILGRLYPRPEIPWDLDFTIFLRYDSYWPKTLGPMREHPRYHALMRKINFRWGLDADGGLSEVPAETTG